MRRQKETRARGIGVVPWNKDDGANFFLPFGLRDYNEAEVWGIRANSCPFLWDHHCCM